MTRARAWFMVMGALLLIGCKPAAPREAERPVSEGEPASRPPIEAPTSEPPREQSSGEQTKPVVVADASLSPCEQLCGRMHGCLLERPEPDERGAAALELTCLSACLQGTTPGANELASSAFAACADVPESSCPELLGCLDSAWPTPSTSSPPAVEADDLGGCARGCRALSACFPDATAEAIAACVEGCERLLVPDDQAAFGACADLSDCGALLACLRTFPGA